MRRHEEMRYVRKEETCAFRYDYSLWFGACCTQSRVFYSFFMLVDA
jgi:hypothetical protein